MKSPKQIAVDTPLLIYQTHDGRIKIAAQVSAETLWLSQQQMAELFQSTKQNISLHLQNVFTEGELPEESVVKDFLTTAADGKNYRTKHYNLDAILSVGYRVKSAIATRFRIWATQSLREYIAKVFFAGQREHHVFSNRAKQAALGDYGANCR